MDCSCVKPRGLAAEFLGTMMLIIAAIGSVVLVGQITGIAPGDPLPLWFIIMNAVAVGFVLFALIETFGPLSGAHFNPAVTISLTITGECSLKKAGCYIAAQLLGALFGVLLVNVFFYDTVQGLFFISEIERSSLSLVLSEFFCVFMLVGIIFGCVRGGSDRTPLVVGLFVAGMILTTSSTMFANPAVTTARIFTNAVCGIAPLSALYFIIAGIAGAVAAAFLFGWLYPKKLKKGERCDAFDCSAKEVNMVVMKDIK